MVSLHSQLLLICIIVANVEAKASSSIFWLAASYFFVSTISLTCAHVFYIKKQFNSTVVFSNKSSSPDPAQNRLVANVGLEVIKTEHCTLYTVRNSQVYKTLN